MEKLKVLKVLGCMIKEVETYAVNIPRYLHNEERCKVAKEQELQKFDHFQVYSEVRDEGQKKLGTNWVLTEKVRDDKVVVD